MHISSGLVNKHVTKTIHRVFMTFNLHMRKYS